MPYRAFKRNLTASYFAPFILTLSMLAGVMLWRFHDQASITGRVEHSDQVILRVKDIELELREMQSSLRGYLLTSDRRYLTELGDARDALGKNITKLASLVADNPSQEQRVLEINDLKEAWTEAIDSMLTQKAVSQVNKDSLAEVQARASALFTSLESFIAAEHQLRIQRAARQRIEYYVVFVLVPALTALAVIFLSYWGWHQIQLATAQFHAALDTAERARDAAEQAGAAAEKANRAKDNFVGMVSHELRTPLNSIMLWSAALLRNPALGQDAHRGMTAIERAVKAQVQLIEDLLDISRIESGRMRLDVQAVDLAEVVSGSRKHAGRG